MNIGIFGGAFNPIHNGHLHLIEKLTVFTPDCNSYDKLILIPTANPPHKSGESLISGEHRINMLKLAIFENENISDNIKQKISISTIEFETSKKSYTYNTLKRLKKTYPEDKLYLLMGSDQFLSFQKWYRYKDILKMADISAITRNENEQDIVKRFMQDNQDDLMHKACCIAVNPTVVSSTDIRNRIKNGDNICDLVPDKVAKYIKDNNLYV